MDLGSSKGHEGLRQAFHLILWAITSGLADFPALEHPLGGFL